MDIPTHFDLKTDNLVYIEYSIVIIYDSANGILYILYLYI